MNKPPPTARRDQAKPKKPPINAATRTKRRQPDPTQMQWQRRLAELKTAIDEWKERVAKLPITTNANRQFGTSLDDLLYLADLVEIPPAQVERMTAGEILYKVEVWFDRQLTLQNLREKASTPRGKKGGRPPISAETKADLLREYEAAQDGEGLTQKEFAERKGMKPSVVSDWLRDARSARGAAGA